MSSTATAARDSVVFLDHYDMRNLLTSVRMPLSKADIDVTTFAQQDMECLVSMRDATLSMEGFRKGDLASFKGLMAEALGTSETNHIVTYGPFGGDIGKQCFLLNSHQNSAEANSPYNQAVMFSAVFRGTGGPRMGEFLFNSIGNQGIPENEVVQVTEGAGADAQAVFILPPTILGAGGALTLASGVTSSDFQTAVRALAGYNDSGVTVSGPDGSGNYLITMAGALSGYDVRDWQKFSGNGWNVRTINHGSNNLAFNLITGAVTGTSVDNGSATYQGYTLHVHVNKIAGTTPVLTVIIEHSDDNATWSTLYSCAPTSVATHYRIENSVSMVKRYTRARATLTGTTPKAAFSVGFSRYGDAVN